MIWLRATCLVLAGLIGIACAATPPAGPATQPASVPGSLPASGPVEILFLHVNDSHGQIEGKAGPGGYARLATLIDQACAEPRADRIFLVHCGDILSRGDALTRRTLGEANFDILNMLRFEAWTPGNGDFYGGLGVLQARIQQARFPTLAANVSIRATSQPLAKSYFIAQAGPVRVAFFGLCFVRTNLPGGWAIKLDDPIETAGRLVPELRRQADVVVAMTHIGYDEDVKLARKVPGIDLILGAHSHTHLPEGRLVEVGKRSTLVCQAGDELRFLGTVRMVLRPGAGGYKLQAIQAKTIPVDQTVKLDPKIQSLVARWAEKAQSQPASQPEKPQPVPAGVD